MKVAIPPRFVAVTPDNSAIMPSHKIGELVPWSEYKSSLSEHEKTVRANATAANKPPSAEGEKLAFQAIIQKVAAENGISPEALTDVRKLMPAIQKSTTLSPEEKNHAVAYLTANPTPSAQGTNSLVRVEGLGQMREYPVINRSTGQLEMRNAAEINASNGGFMPAGEGARTQDKNAIFQDLHYNLDTAKNAVSALVTLDPGTRAALANQLQETDPRSAISAFLHGAIGTQLTPQQKHAVLALAQLSENALSLRSVAGMGQGAQDLRDAIRSVLPSAKSPDVPYMMDQLKNFEQVVSRLESPTQQRLGAGPRNQTPSPGKGGPAPKPTSLMERWGYKPAGQ